MVKTNKALIGLWLLENKIDDRGVQILANAITNYNTSLKYLELSTNKPASDSSLDALVEMLKHNQTLTVLYVPRCTLSKKGKKKLREMVKSKKGPSNSMNDSIFSKDVLSPERDNRLHLCNITETKFLL